jgi:hypothetical protein
MKKKGQTSKSYLLELLEPRILLSADPVVETIQSLTFDTAEVVINVDENYSESQTQRPHDHSDIHQTKKSPQDTSSDESEENNEDDKSEMNEETEFFGLTSLDGKYLFDFLTEDALEISDVSDDLTFQFSNPGTFSSALGDDPIDAMIADFFHVDGNFSIDSYTNDLLLSDGSTIIADYTVISGSDDINVFVGINGPANTESAMGFELQEVNFALVKMDSTVDDRSWSTVKAFASKVGLVNIPDFDISVDTLNVEINIENNGSDIVADFSENPLIINNGLEYDITIDFDGDMGSFVKAEGEIRFNIADYFTGSGTIEVATQKENLILNIDEIIETDILTLAGTDVGGFAGYGYPDNTDNSMGFILNDVDFGMAYARPSDNADNRSWIAFDGTAGYVGFQGPENIEVSGSDILVAMNLSSDDNAFADFSQKPLNIDLGDSNEVTFNFDGDLGQIMKLEGGFDLSIHDFFQANGQMAFEHYTRDFTLADQSTVETALFTAGAIEMDVFAGIGPKNSDNALGFAVDQADFGLALITPKDSSDNRSWTALKADAGQAGFIGSDDIDINAQNIGVNLNLVQNDNENVVDFANAPLEIQVGPDANTTIDFHGENGNMMSIETYSTINLFDFFQTEGNVAFEQMRQDVDIMQTDGSIETHKMNVMSVGLEGFSASAQQGMASFALTGVDIGLAMISDPSVEGHNKQRRIDGN